MKTSSTTRQCLGYVYITGLRCDNEAKPQYDYCCAAHDPWLPCYSPRLFDSFYKSRSLLEPHVVRYYEGRDLYHGDKIDLATPGAVELDHIFEKQCWAFAFHNMPFHDPIGDSVYLANVVRDEIVNGLANVCLTRTATNKMKGAAVWQFIDDAITGHTNGVTFADYLAAEERDQKRLEETTRRSIIAEMCRALHLAQYKLADQGETPLLWELSRQLEIVRAEMGLTAD